LQDSNIIMQFFLFGFSMLGNLGLNAIAFKSSIEFARLLQI